MHGTHRHLRKLLWESGGRSVHRPGGEQEDTVHAQACVRREEGTPTQKASTQHTQRAQDDARGRFPCTVRKVGGDDGEGEGEAGFQQRAAACARVVRAQVGCV